MAAYVLTGEQAAEMKIEAEVLRNSISGPRVKRYAPCNSDQRIIYTSRQTNITAVPNAYAYLSRFRGSNTCKEVAARKHPFWAPHRPRDPDIFASPKLIGITTSKRIELVLDRDQSLYATDAMYVFRITPDTDPLAVMAVMQSRLFLFLYRTANQGESRIIPQIKASKVQTLPFPLLRPSLRAVRGLHSLALTMESLRTLQPGSATEHARTLIERRGVATEKRIDRIVFELYGLTGAEIELVERSTQQPAP